MSASYRDGWGKAADLLLRDVMWANRGWGSFAEVLDDGRIAVGDSVSWIN